MEGWRDGGMEGWREGGRDSALISPFILLLLPFPVIYRMSRPLIMLPFDAIC